MSKVTNGPTVVNSGLIAYLDAANNRSYDKYENLATNSEAFNSWPLNNGGGITVTANSEIAPNGTLTADRLAQSSATNATRYLVSNVGVTYASQIYTISCWVRKVSGSDSGGNLYFGFYGDSGRTSIINATSNWERYSWTTTLPASGSATIGIYSDWDINGASNNNVYAVWGFQVELGSSLTDYYPTTTTAKTRGTRWFDLSKNRVDNHILSGATFSNINKGVFVFDGTDAITRVGAINTGQNFTVNAWIYPTSFSTRNAIVGNAYGYTTAWDGWLFSLGSTTNAFFISIGTDNAYRVTGTNTLSTNKWQYISGVVTDGGQTITLYLNGETTTTSASLLNNGSITYNNTEFNIGYRNTQTPDQFIGNIGVVQIYNRALSQTEIQQNYNTTKNRFGL